MSGAERTPAARRGCGRSIPSDAPAGRAALHKYDLAKFPPLTSKPIGPRAEVFDIAVRAKRLDEVVRRFVARHPDAVVLAFNLHTTWAVWAVKHSRALATIADGVANSGFNDPREPERWAPGLRLVEEIFLTRAPEHPRSPRR